MRRWLGFIGSWAVMVLALGVLSLSVAGEWINFKDARRLKRYAVVDALLNERLAGLIAGLRQDKDRSESSANMVRSKLEGTSRTIDEAQDTAQTIVVSTTENLVYVRNKNATIFRAVCSTGKHATLVDGGRTLVFRTPVGKFKVRSKEENPVWVPPDWHYIEAARLSGRKVLRLNPGQSIDADTGAAAKQSGGGVWNWIGDARGSRRVLVVKNNTVVELSRDGERELPAGAMIVAGKTLIIPPFGTPQRKFEKVLGAYRLNLGDGYALHGTLATNQLGQSVSHGCVRLGDADIERLYKMANVGDEVFIY